MTNAEEVRGLISKLGTTQCGAAKLIGITDRQMRRYCSEKDNTRAPQAVLMALESLLGVSHEHN